jgi:hypothetical protein
LQFRTPGPNPLDSAAYAADFNEVKLLGRVDSGARTDEQTHNALFWQTNGGPALLWNDVASDLIETPSYHIGMLAGARILAMMDMAGADASINAWNDKYYYDFWRPWHAIQQADADGNPATDADPSWTALLTAPYPDHPSGHLSLDGAMLGVLQSFFGDDVAFGATSSRFGGETRFFDHFSDVLAEITWRASGPASITGRGRAREDAWPEHRRVRGGELLPAGRKPLENEGAAAVG